MLRLICTCSASTSKLTLSSKTIKSFSTSIIKKSSTPIPIATSPILPTTKVSTTATIVSSCPAGTILKGLNFRKDATDPIALEDSEYPTWLFDLVSTTAVKSSGKKSGLKEVGVTGSKQLEDRLKKESKELKKGRKIDIKAKNNLSSR